MKSYCEKCEEITKQKTCPQGYVCNKCGTVYNQMGKVIAMEVKK